MKNITRSFLALMFVTNTLFSEPISACTKGDGFLPENHLFIPAGHKEALGVTEEEFNRVIDQVEEHYSSIVSQQGGELLIERRWDDGTVNAYAERTDGPWKVSMFGGLARHKTMTKDGLALVVCHELGHHIGGMPKYEGGDWAANEGQSDYFATLKCLRRLWQSEDNAAAVSELSVPEVLTTKCREHWPEKIDQEICIRSGMAGDSVARLFKEISFEETEVTFETPDALEVEVTNNSHPGTQCRLDTYLQGALCEKVFSEDISQNDEITGACHQLTGHTVGLRPRCWFSPATE